MKIFQKQTKTLYLQFIVDESQEIVKVTFERENKLFNRKTLQYVISLDFFNTLDIENTSITKLHNIIKDSSSDDDTPCSPQSEPVLQQTGEGDIFILNDVSILSEQLVFCDTETTGLGNDDEICEISLIDYNGNVLLDTLVKPTKRIPQQATKVHGITNSMVASAPSFSEVWSDFEQSVNGKHIVFYNADFDTRMIVQSVASSFHSDLYTFAQLFNQNIPYSLCLMHYYARYWGEWNDYHHNYKWQSLINACKQQKIRIDDVSNHRSLGDCIKTLRLYKHLQKVA